MGWSSFSLPASYLRPLHSILFGRHPLKVISLRRGL